jgi:hypothetical protein
MKWYQWVFFIVLLILTIPNFLASALACLFLFWAVHKYRIEDRIILTALIRDRFKKYWRYSTTVVNFIFFQHRRAMKTDALWRVEKHERVHVRQFQDYTVLAFFVGYFVVLLTGNWLLGLGLWLSGPFWMLPNFFTALLRNARPRPSGVGWWQHWGINTMYRDSEHERSAYAQTYRHPDDWVTMRVLWRDKT